MATLREIGTILNAVPADDIFVRFKAACTIAAKNIRAENPQTTNHEPRLSWANGVLSGDQYGVESRVAAHLRYGIATNATFQMEGLLIDDAAVQFIVESQIDVFAV